MTYVVLATGPGLTQEVVDYVRGKAKVIAVSDAYKLAPWADALVSNDAAWWMAHPEALKFEGEKYTGAPDWHRFPGVTRIVPEGLLATGSNSGMLACHLAYKKGAKRIILCGFDMHGTHFFGPHPTPLRNTPPERFAAFKKQFSRWHPEGVSVINCTPNTALRCYPMADLKDVL